MDKNTKTILVILLGVIAVAWLIGDQVVQNNLTIGTTPTPSSTPATGASKTPTGNVSPGSGGTAGTQNYDQLIVQYEGKRVQFDIGCQAIPARISYKNGTTVMFDNRSGDARTITIDGKKYNFPGYGYKIVTLSSATTPYTVLLSCGSAVNVGVIDLY